MYRVYLHKHDRLLFLALFVLPSVTDPCREISADISALITVDERKLIILSLSLFSLSLSPLSHFSFFLSLSYILHPPPACAHKHTHAHIHTETHTHKHTHKHTRSPRRSCELTFVERNITAVKPPPTKRRLYSFNYSISRNVIFKRGIKFLIHVQCSTLFH